MLHVLRALVMLFAFSPALVWADQPFAYYPPGSLLPNSGSRKQMSTGQVDYEVHVPGMLFPLEKAFANSQTFNIGGLWYTGIDQGNECDQRNYVYPWQDDFCEFREDRNHQAELCPSGWAHQGQDIRPATCVSDVHPVVAVEDGRVTKSYKGVLVVITLDGFTTYEYLHMSTVFQAGDMKQQLMQLRPGDRVKRGQRLGFVSNIMGVEGGTSHHLHFGMLQKVQDKDGKYLAGGSPVYRNPYMSLVRSYETMLDQTGAMLPAPAICQPKSRRCLTNFLLAVIDKKKDPDPRHAGTIVCNAEGTAETIEWCSDNSCGTATSCDKNGSPSDLSLPLPLDMSIMTPADLAVSCDPRACLCGCNGSSCRNQICTPRSAYCTTATTLIECSTDGCSSLTKSCGYGCTGNRCNDPPGTVDMSVPLSVDMSVPPPKTEVCNGIDDDGNGIIDDPSSCWQWITRFKDPITQARCYGVGSIPPFACAAYDREFVLFVVPTVPWSDGSNSLWVQCSRGIDHVLTAYGSTEYGALTTLGWNCSLQLGYFFNFNQGPRLPKKTPFTYTCLLYRQRFSTSGSQSHFYTPFSESVGGATCELPARADVLAVNACGVAVGC